MLLIDIRRHTVYRWILSQIIQSGAWHGSAQFSILVFCFCNCRDSIGTDNWRLNIQREDMIIRSVEKLQIIQIAISCSIDSAIILVIFLAITSAFSSKFVVKICLQSAKLSRRSNQKLQKQYRYSSIPPYFSLHGYIPCLHGYLLIQLCAYYYICMPWYQSTLSV